MDEYSDRYSNLPHHEQEELPNEIEPDEDEDSGSIFEVLLTVAAALALAFFVSGYLVKPYRIPSESMENTLRCRDRVLVDRLSFNFRDPKRNEVVVFHPPASVSSRGIVDRGSVGMSGDAGRRIDKYRREVTAAKINYIKRIVGMPGDKLSVHSNFVYINGKKRTEPFLRPMETNELSSSSDWGPITVPKGTYFMMGDNRENSTDARFFGPVPKEFVVGKAFFIYWPPTRFGTVPKREKGGADATKPDPNCLESAIA